MTRSKQNFKQTKCNSNENSDNSFNEEDRRYLHEINETVKMLVEEIKILKTELESSNCKIKRLETENWRLKQSTNRTLFKLDALDQYGRRENLRIHGVPETTNNFDDGEEVVKRIAETLNVNLQSYDVQRAHRLGKRISINGGKPRPIIARFVSYKKRNEILFAKAKLKNSETYSNVFISEDLTPLRSKLLQYVKKECSNEFVLCHTTNGNIRMKKSARKAGTISENEKDLGFGSWLVASSPNDLFKFNIDINFLKLNYKPLLFNCDNLTTASSSL